MKRQTPHYEPNQIRLWLYIISADCWWGALIICSHISPRLVWTNRQLPLSTPTISLTNWFTALVAARELLHVFVFLFNWTAALVEFKTPSRVKVTLRQRVTHHSGTSGQHLNPSYLGAPGCLCGVISCLFYSLSNHRAATGDAPIIYCRWRLSAEHEVRQFGSLCVVHGSLAVGSGSHCAAFCHGSQVSKVLRLVAYEHIL